MFFDVNYMQFLKENESPTSTGMLEMELSDMDGSVIAVANTKRPIKMWFKQKKIGKYNLVDVINVVPDIERLRRNREFFRLITG